MSDIKTNLFGNLRSLYQSYGGIRGVLRSAYFQIALVLTLICWRLPLTEQWATLSQSMLPTLAGFTIAAFAILFAVLDEKSRRSLMAPEQTLQGRSPFLMLGSSIAHAVVIQMVTVIYSVLYTSKPIPTPQCLDTAAAAVNYVLGLVGTLGLMYSLCLVPAAILSIFKIMELRAKVL